MSPLKFMASKEEPENEGSALAMLVAMATYLALVIVWLFEPSRIALYWTAAISLFCSWLFSNVVAQVMIAQQSCHQMDYGEDVVVNPFAVEYGSDDTDINASMQKDQTDYHAGATGGAGTRDGSN